MDENIHQEMIERDKELLLKKQIALKFMQNEIMAWYRAEFSKPKPNMFFQKVCLSVAEELEKECQTLKKRIVYEAGEELAFDESAEIPTVCYGDYTKLRETAKQIVTEKITAAYFTQKEKVKITKDELFRISIDESKSMAFRNGCLAVINETEALWKEFEKETEHCPFKVLNENTDKYKLSNKDKDALVSELLLLVKEKQKEYIK